MDLIRGPGLTLAVIGTGNMGGAVLSGVLDSSMRKWESGSDDWPFSKFIACVQSEASATRLELTFAKYADYLTVFHGDNLKAAEQADVILLACKPYLAEKILGANGMKEALAGKLLISILAGLTTASLQNYVHGGSDMPEPLYVIRAMPNMAARIGESMTVIATPDPGTPKHCQDLAEWIFKQVGGIRPISDELFDAGSVLVGTTAAFMTVAFDGILDGAVAEGIKRSEAQEMLVQSLIGMAKLIAGGEHPALLREKISSPRGTTIQGLLALEEAGVRSAFSKAVIAAAARGKNIK